MRKVIEYFSRRGIITNWLILIIMAAGVFGLTQLKRRVWPQFEMDYLNVAIAWPGASALEVEEGLTIKIEENLKGIEGIDRTVSTTRDGFVHFWVETDPSVPMSKIIDKVRSGVDTIPDYPDGADRARISREESWAQSMLLFIYGPEDLTLLQRISDDFRNELLATGEVTQIDVWGLPEREILVEVTPALIKEYDLSLDDLAAAIRASSLDTAAGAVETGEENLMLRAYGSRTTPEELSRIPVPIPTGTVPLGNLCRITEAWPEEAVYTRTNGQPAVGLGIMYTGSEDIVVISEVVDERIAEAEKQYGDLVTFKPFFRDNEQIEQRLGTLTKSGLLGLLLVVLILGIFLNIRLSLWVAFGIPFSFLGLLFIEWVTGITINEMSLFGMIVVLGILVDDGIVIGENIYAHAKQGKTPLRAAIDGTLEVIGPVAVSIITTMVAFTPYFFLYGEMGDYTSVIGWVVVICLAFSLIEAAIILPVHLAHSKAVAENGREPSRLRRGLDRFQEHLIHKVYARVLRWALSHRGLVLAILAGALLVVVGAIMGNHINAMFFPEVEMPYSYVEIGFPSGTGAPVIDEVRDEVTRVALEVGSEEEWTVPEKGYDNAIQDVLSWGDSKDVTIYFSLIPNEDRPYPGSKFSMALSERLGHLSEAESLTVGEESAFGGSPISVRFVGTDREALAKAAALFKEELRKIEGVKDIRDDTPPGAREIAMAVNPRGRALGLSLGNVMSQVRSGWYGVEAASIIDGPRQVPVMLRLPPEERRHLGQLDRFPVKTPGDEWVLLGDVVDYELGRGVEVIKRENGFRAVRVNASLDYSKNDLNVVLAEVNDVIVPAVLAQVPGITRSAGGQAEAVQRMMNSMLYSMAAALVIMFTILMIATNSPGQATLIMVLIPMGFVGAIFGHAIIGIPLSFISFLGGLALAGIIVNDSVVFIDTYNRMIRKDEEIDPVEAAFLAGVRRFRPILLTTLTTALGLTPLIFQKSVGGQFLIPIAVSIAFGLLFGTFLTMLVLPCVLSLMGEARKRRLARKAEGNGRRRPAETVLVAFTAIAGLLTSKEPPA